MQTRRTSRTVATVLVCAVVLALLSGAVLPAEEGLGNIPIQGPVSHDSSFVGSLTITAFTFGGTRQLLLTGVLNGTVTDITGAKTKVQNQPFTAPATVTDSGRTADVLLLDIEPIHLDSLGLQIEFAQITLDINAIPRGDILSVKLLDYE